MRLRWQLVHATRRRTPFAAHLLDRAHCTRDRAIECDRAAGQLDALANETHRGIEGPFPVEGLKAPGNGN